MRYIHTSWIHQDPDDPIELYSELDDESWEIRKVEVFREGKIGFAGASESSGSTNLGLEPVPPLEAIDLDGQFRSREITRAEFEHLWERARNLADSLQEWNVSRANPREG